MTRWPSRVGGGGIGVQRLQSSTVNILSEAVPDGELDCVHVDLEEQSWMVALEMGRKDPSPLSFPLSSL